MKKLHCFHFNERPIAALLRDVLIDQGVECILRNEHLFSAIGEIPAVECFPELWVVDEEVYPKARCLLDRWLTDGDSGDDWKCPACGENLAAVFGACWSCGYHRE